MKLFERFASKFASMKAGNDSLRAMLYALRNSSIEFEVKKVIDDGQPYFVAESIDLQMGAIVTSAPTLEELETNLKDAIFTAFGVPARFCNDDLINLSNFPIQKLQQRIHATT